MGKQNQVKFYCYGCDRHNFVEIEPLQKDGLNRDLAYGDIVCAGCHFVIATMSCDVEGIYNIVAEARVSE